MEKLFCRFAGSTEDHVALPDQMLSDPQFNHVATNLVWDEAAKVVDRDADFTKARAKLIMKHPTRLRFAIPRIRAWEHENRNRYPAWLVSDRRFPN